MEPEEMKEKWELLNQKLSQQIIINETMIKSTLKGKINHEVNVSIISIIIYIILVPLCIVLAKIGFMHWITTYVIEIFLLTGVPIHWYGISLVFKLRKFEDNLILAQQRAVKMKKYTIIATFHTVVFVIMAFAYIIFSDLDFILEVYWLFIFELTLFVGLSAFVRWNYFIEIKDGKSVV